MHHQPHFNLFYMFVKHTISVSNCYLHFIHLGSTTFFSIPNGYDKCDYAVWELGILSFRNSDYNVQNVRRVILKYSNYAMTLNISQCKHLY